MEIRAIQYEGEREFDLIYMKAKIFLDHYEDIEVPPIQSIIYNLLCLYMEEMDKETPNLEVMNVLLDTIELAEYFEAIQLTPSKN